MIKVLYLPLNAGAGVQEGMYDAWHFLQTNLLIFDFLNEWEKLGRDREKLIKLFLSKVESFQPNLIHMQLQLTGIFTPESLIEARKLCRNKVIITNWTGDIRNKPAAEMAVLSPVVDYTLISSTGQIKDYEKMGCKNIKYWQIGYDPKYHYPKNQDKFKYDLAFAGNAYSPNSFTDCALRLKILEKLKKKLGEKFGLFGFGYHDKFGNVTAVPGKEVNNVYNDSVAILNISHYNDVSHYFSDRLLTCLASGRPTISYRFPNYESYFTHNSDILIANNVEEILKFINYCKDNSEKANLIGANGYAKAKSEHTYHSRVAELLFMTGLR